MKEANSQEQIESQSNKSGDYEGFGGHERNASALEREQFKANNYNKGTPGFYSAQEELKFQKVNSAPVTSKAQKKPLVILLEGPVQKRKKGNFGPISS